MSQDSEVKILVLGSNPETSEIVRVANLEGYKTYVVNPVENSPAKKIASVTYDADPKNQEEIDEIILSERINAVVLGVSDPLLPFYQSICERHGFPCYANKKSVRILSSKSEFASYCRSFDINPIPTFVPDDIILYSDESSIFPVVIKPIDSGAAVGISLCNNKNEFKYGLEFALQNSIAKKVIVEKYMDCDDLFAYYTIINGKAHLTMLADRHKSTKAGAFNSVCLYANYPSRHLNAFLKFENLKIVTMIESLKINFGVLGIQIFYDGNNFYAYDPGFRVQGEGPHFYLNDIQEFDQIKMLLKFSIDGKLSDTSLDFRPDPTLAGYLARTIWILGKPGTVSEIIGVEEILLKPNVLKVLIRFAPGDHLSEDMIGTERQVLMRIYTFGKTQKEIDELNHYIAETIRVIDHQGDSLISDLFVP